MWDRHNSVFQLIKKSPVQTPHRPLCPSATVVRVHVGALAEGYEVSSTTLVVVEVCC